MSVAPKAAVLDGRSAYALGFADWLACACAGAGERASRAVRALGDDLPSDVAFAATAGHVLDYDDTFADGVAHVSAATAPAALMLSAHLNLSLEHALTAYAEGFEAMASVAAASHPALYEAGWHPTAVCGPVGAAVAASRLLGLDRERRTHAIGLSLLRAGGARGAFGSDGKAVQVGLASAAGVQAALLARAGATVDAGAVRGQVGFEAVTGASVPLDVFEAAMGAGASLDGPGAAAVSGRRRAITRNWIKLYPSCLGTHSPIRAAAEVREHVPSVDRASLVVTVHPTARRAAHRDDVDDGLAAKFSIHYCVAHTLGHGPPSVRDFDRIDPAVRAAARRVAVRTDASLPEFGAVLGGPEGELARVEAPPGSPELPLTPAERAGKAADLAGERLEGLLDDVRRPAREVVLMSGLRRSYDRRTR